MQFGVAGAFLLALVHVQVPGCFQHDGLDPLVLPVISQGHDAAAERKVNGYGVTPGFQVAAAGLLTRKLNFAPGGDLLPACFAVLSGKSCGVFAKKLWSGALYDHRTCGVNVKNF